jgi:hypothetical protein
VSSREAARLSNRTAAQETANATAAKLATSHPDGTAYPDSSGELPALVQYVTGGGDRPPLDRLHSAARDGRELIKVGTQQVAVVASLTFAAEAAGVPRRVAEEVLLRTLRGAR